MSNKKSSPTLAPTPAPQRPRAEVVVLQHHEDDRELTLEAMRQLQDLQATQAPVRLQLAATFAAALIANLQTVRGGEPGETIEQAVCRCAVDYTDALLSEMRRRDAATKGGAL